MEARGYDGVAQSSCSKMRSARFRCSDWGFLRSGSMISKVRAGERQAQPARDLGQPRFGAGHFAAGARATAARLHPSAGAITDPVRAWAQRVAARVRAVQPAPNQPADGLDRQSRFVRGYPAALPRSAERDRVRRKTGLALCGAEPATGRFRPRSYADNFKYEVQDAIARAKRPWDGQLSISGRGDTEDAAPSAMAARAPRAAASPRAAADYRALARH